MSPAPQPVSKQSGSSIDPPPSGIARLAGETEKPSRPTPGDLATPRAILQLANEYRRAADALFEARRKRRPLSLAPCRLSAIHAIELYLNAFLLNRGWNAKRLRSLQHDLMQRADEAANEGLLLRDLTKIHLKEMTDGREYAVSRYGPEMTATHSQINRLTSTLKEVAEKVSSMMERDFKTKCCTSQPCRSGAASGSSSGPPRPQRRSPKAAHVDSGISSPNL